MHPARWRSSYFIYSTLHIHYSNVLCNVIVNRWTVHLCTLIRDQPIMLKILLIYTMLQCSKSPPIMPVLMLNVYLLCSILCFICCYSALDSLIMDRIWVAGALSKQLHFTEKINKTTSRMTVLLQCNNIVMLKVIMQARTYSITQLFYLIC